MTLYILFTLLLITISFFSYLFLDQNFFYLKNLYSGFATANRLEVSVSFISLIFSFFIFYISYIYLVRKKQIAFGNFKTILILTVLILLPSYPAMVSSDIFNYIATAKTIFFYGENPYLIMPIEFVNDSILFFTHAANKLALYGPFWIGLTSLPYFLGLGNFLFTLLLFKLTIVLFYLGTVYLLWRMTKNLFAVSLFALNPLVIFETIVSGHNDIAMMFFALLSFYFLKKKNIFIAVILLTLSILIKYATIFLVPVFLYAIWKIIESKDLDWEKVFKYCGLSMFAIFLLSFIREEIYPWYAIWFISFLPFVYKNKFFLYGSIAFSFGLLFRHVPFILLGTHFGPSPVLKTLITFVPSVIVVIYIWLKKSTKNS